MMAKILVVDDETDLEVLIKQKFRKQIRQNEYEFVFAINGKDALEKLRLEPDMDIVLSDINMPEMDGLTLLSELNALNPLLKSVIVSAYGDMENIRTAMNRGLERGIIRLNELARPPAALWIARARNPAVRTKPPRLRSRNRSRPDDGTGKIHNKPILNEPMLTKPTECRPKRHHKCGL